MQRCNNPNCGVSTGVCGSLTFGSGKLDKNGYWEVPCRICAEEFEKSSPEYGQCWPTEEFCMKRTAKNILIKEKEATIGAVTGYVYLKLSKKYLMCVETSDGKYLEIPEDDLKRYSIIN